MNRSQSGVLYLQQWEPTGGLSTLDPVTGEVTRILDFPEGGVFWLASGPGDTVFVGVVSEIWQVWPDGSYDVWGPSSAGWPQFYTQDGRLIGVNGTEIGELHPDGSFDALAGGFDYVYDTVVNEEGVIFVTDFARGDLYRIDPDDTQRTLLSGVVNRDPMDLAFDQEGNLYLNSVNTGLALVNQDTGALTRFPHTLGEFAFVSPSEVVFSNHSQSQVYRMDMTTGDLSILVSNRGIYSEAMDIGPDGQLYLGTWSDGQTPAQVLRFGDDGSMDVVIDNLPGMVRDVTFDPGGGLYVLTRDGDNYQIFYRAEEGEDLIEIPYVAPGASALAFDSESGKLLVAVWEGTLLEYSFEGWERRINMALPKPVNEFFIDIAPDGTVYAYGAEMERQRSGPVVDRWILRLDLAQGTSEIVTEYPHTGCCTMGNLGVDDDGEIWWLVDPEFHLVLVTPEGDQTLFASDLPTDPISVMGDTEGDVYLSTPAGVLRFYYAPEAYAAVAYPDQPPPTPEPPDAEPVFVSVLCGLTGGEVKKHVPRDRPVVLVWGWSAATVEQVQHHIDASQTVVELDGQPVEGRLVDGPGLIESWGSIGAMWHAEVGILSPGSHSLTYTVTWSEPVYDGQDNYGPGTENETQMDECVIIVD
jgi:hypothetical protein